MVTALGVFESVGIALSSSCTAYHSQDTHNCEFCQCPVQLNSVYCISLVHICKKTVCSSLYNFVTVKASSNQPEAVGVMKWMAPMYSRHNVNSVYSLIVLGSPQVFTSVSSAAPLPVLLHLNVALLQAC